MASSREVFKPIPSDIDEQRLFFKDHKYRREQEFIFIPQIRFEVSIQKVQVSSILKICDMADFGGSCSQGPM